MTVETGTAGTAARIITEKDTALAVGSGSLAVCATPVLSAVMEAAAVNALDGRLPDTETTVGISLALTHSAPTLTGRTITATAVLTRTEGRRFFFRITARDDAGEVGTADHVRCLVEAAPFMEKAGRRYRKHEDR